MSSSSSLLYEGYALYPYTPGAAKNATPTPFGIVYPPDYAETRPAAFSTAAPRVRRCADGAEAKLTGSVRFLQAAGERHKGVERRLDPCTSSLADLAREPLDLAYSFDAEDCSRCARRSPGGCGCGPSCSAPSSPGSALRPQRLRGRPDRGG